MRVNTCSICEKLFWSGTGVDKNCYSCQFQIDRKEDEKERKRLQLERRHELERFKRNKGRVVIAKNDPAVKKSKKEIDDIYAAKREAEKKHKAEQRKIFKEQKMFGYVYLIRAENEFYKIGLSKNVKQRLSGLESQYPIQMGVIHSFACHDVRKVEKALHKMFANKRAQREWFRLDAADITWIMNKKDYSLG